jgi:hypothetical protein
MMRLKILNAQKMFIIICLINILFVKIIKIKRKSDKKKTNNNKEMS